MVGSVHPTAIVDPAAQLGQDVVIGPYCVVGPGVRLDDGVCLVSHVVVEGLTSIGAGTRVHAFACLGNPPQHLRYAGEPTRLVIGRNNVVREYVTMNPGTPGGRGITTVGDDGFFMVGAHIAHDCRVGNQVVMANNATLGGHVEVGDHVILGGLSAVHQYVRIGEHAFVGGTVAVRQDVIPFGLVKGYPGRLSGLNLVGLKRRGFGREAIHRLRAAYRALFDGPGEWRDRIAAMVDTHAGEPAVQRLIDFVRAESERGILKPTGPDEDA